MNVKECSRISGKSEISTRKLCKKICPGNFYINGVGSFSVIDVRSEGSKHARYEITRIDGNTNNSNSDSQNEYEMTLKDKHLQIKIEKEQQQIYEHRILFAEKIKDIFVQEFHLPRISRLTEIVRKNAEKKTIELWNQEIKAGLEVDLRSLSTALEELILK